MSDVEQWEHDEQRAMEQEIAKLREALAIAKVLVDGAEFAGNLNASGVAMAERFRSLL